MSRLNFALAGGAPGVTGANLTWVVVVAVIALLALAVAGVLVRQVLAASKGTEKMQEIALSIQEGAAAYLRRQFRTLSVFVVLIFFVLCYALGKEYEDLGDDRAAFRHFSAGAALHRLKPLRPR